MGVTVIAALFLLGGCGSSDGDDSSAVNRQVGWVGDASRLCSQAFYHREHMPPVHIATYDKVVPQMARNERTLATRLGDLATSRRDAESIDRLARLLIQQSHQADAAVRTFGAYPYGAHGRVPQYEAHVQAAQRLDDEIGVVARALGANSCANTPLRSEAL
jgi:hypothetical protein